MSSPFTQYKPWMIKRYGDALFRVPIQLASFCPHGRCTFCSENGAKAQQTQRQVNPIEQIEAAIQFSKRRYKARKLMLYIQAFTADLTNPAQQEQILQCLNHCPFETISIGTRPDCLPDNALDFLERLKVCRPGDLTRREVWVELGVQTTHDETLIKIKRGHDWACSREAILKVAKRGIYVAPHVIIGLPGETPADWNRTAEELAALPIAGIKIHNLHIPADTELASEYTDNPFPILNHWEYGEALIDFLRRIPANIPVIRISTDTPDNELVAPHWHLEKGQFLDYIIQQMNMREIHQGDLLETENRQFKAARTPVITDDGSITFFSDDWKEHYHTKSGARLEAQKKFVEPSKLLEKLQQHDVQLLDVCFGLGNNSLAALCTEGNHRLDITALEMDKRIVRTAAESFQSLETDPVNWKIVLSELLSHSLFSTHHSSLFLLWGDARYLIQKVSDGSMDIVFHDPFSSQRCPELWTVEFFQQLYRVLKPDGVLLTYSSALPVRGAMQEAGFCVSETTPGYRMGNGTIAAKNREIIKDFPEIKQLDKRRSLPYRDPHLCAPSKTILRMRQEAIEKQILVS